MGGRNGNGHTILHFVLFYSHSRGLHNFVSTSFSHSMQCTLLSFFYILRYTHTRVILYCKSISWHGVVEWTKRYSLSHDGEALLERMAGSSFVHAAGEEQQNMNVGDKSFFLLDPLQSNNNNDIIILLDLYKKGGLLCTVDTPRACFFQNTVSICAGMRDGDDDCFCTLHTAIGRHTVPGTLYKRFLRKWTQLALESRPSGSCFPKMAALGSVWNRVVSDGIEERSTLLPHRLALA